MRRNVIITTPNGEERARRISPPSSSRPRSLAPSSRQLIRFCEIDVCQCSSKPDIINLFFSYRVSSRSAESHNFPSDYDLLMEEQVEATHPWYYVCREENEIHDPANWHSERALACGRMHSPFQGAGSQTRPHAFDEGHVMSAAKCNVFLNRTA